MVDDVIIMAGGSGTRLWPASIRSRPKQFMDPGLGMSLLEATIRRAAALEAPGDILIVAHRDHVDPIVAECGTLPEEIRGKIVVLGEPEAKNTAPAIAVSMAFLGAVGRGPGDGGDGAPGSGGETAEGGRSSGAGGTGAPEGGDGAPGSGGETAEGGRSSGAGGTGLPEGGAGDAGDGAGRGATAGEAGTPAAAGTVGDSATGGAAGTAGEAGTPGAAGTAGGSATPGAAGTADRTATPGPGRTALVLAADHLITPIELFRDAVAAADELAREGYLVTFGVTPTRAETGYGYVEAGEEHGAGYLVHAFREKPDPATAEEYYASGRHYWNSGMFVFEQAAFRRELGEHAPEVADAFGGLLGGGGSGSGAAALPGAAGGGSANSGAAAQPGAAGGGRGGQVAAQPGAAGGGGANSGSAAQPGGAGGGARGQAAASGAEGGARAGFAVRAERGVRVAGAAAPAAGAAGGDATPGAAAGTGPAGEAATSSLPADNILAGAYARAPKISIDYALMERSGHVAMVPAGFTWNDVGSWDEIAALSERGVLDPAAALTFDGPGADTEKTAGAAIEVDGGGNFVFSELPVALAGVEDLIVVIRNGRVLISRRGASQLVKRVVDGLADGEHRGIL